MNEIQVIVGKPENLHNIFSLCNIKCHYSNDDIATSTVLLPKLCISRLIEKGGVKQKASEEFSSNTEVH